VAQTSVTTSAVRLDTAANRPGTVAIKNRGSSSIYLGSDNTVTSANGFELGVGESVSVDLNKSTSAIWAIAGSGTNRVDVLEVGT
jgi:hypothetical protein